MEKPNVTKYIKKYLPPVVFVVVIILSFILTDVVLQIKSEDGIKQAKEFYYQPKNSIDVAFLGSSHIHCNVNTAVLWKEYGIASYDLSAAEQPLWITYHYFKEMLKTQSPKLVVIDMFIPVRYKDDYRYRWIMDNLYGMRFSKNKIDMMQVAVEKDVFWDYFPSYFGYHSRYDEVGRKDIQYIFRTPSDKRAFKGYVPYFERRILEEPKICDMYDVTAVQDDRKIAETPENLTPRSLEYLNKIIDLAKANDIELMFMATPYEILPEEMADYEQIEEIAKNNSIYFINYNLNYKDFGIDYANDFNDFSHLNYEGSCKFTSYLGKDLKDRYDIPDRRGDERYVSWDENAQIIETMAVENPIVTVIE